MKNEREMEKKEKLGGRRMRESGQKRRERWKSKEQKERNMTKEREKEGKEKLGGRRMRMRKVGQKRRRWWKPK